MLKNTYFSKNVYNFYKVAKISVVQVQFDIQTRTLIVLQILHYPSLHSKQVFPLFELHQVGLSSNDICLMLDIPKYLYLKEQKYFPVDQNNCQISQGPISTCFSDILNNDFQDSCLKNFTSCPTRKVSCFTRYVYDTSGILIGSTKAKIQVFIKATQMLVNL